MQIYGVVCIEILKRLCGTRWDSGLDAVIKNLPALIVAPQKIKDGETKGCTTNLMVADVTQLAEHGHSYNT